MQVIFFQPFFQEKIWGGNKLQTEFGLTIPSQSTGEAWMISAHSNGQSIVTSPEIYQGRSLAELYAEEPQLFGPNQPKVFPLLIKILDAREALSIQVHPDDEYAAEHEGPNELGKTECWYIISADEGAKIVYGHHAQTLEDFQAYIHEGKFMELFREIPVETGDFFDVPAGTIHAIGGGITILETQQSSDTTYRVYDYDRKDTFGKTRELHLSQVEDVTMIPHKDSPYTKQNADYQINELEVLLSNDFFEVYRVQVSGEMKLNLSDKYYLATVIEGDGEILLDNHTYLLPLATAFILPYGKKDIHLEGSCTLILTCAIY